MIHRDIKPANLFVCRYGEDVDFVKVLDFGLVKLDETGGDVHPRLTREGVVPGTPAYMPPEVITGRHPVDKRSDIYSLGCVAYWLLTGRLVFEANSPMAMVTEHAAAEPCPPSRRAELEIPEALDDAILACLAKSPDDRPDGAAALARRLESIRLERTWNDERARAWWELTLQRPLRTDCRSCPKKPVAMVKRAS